METTVQRERVVLGVTMGRAFGGLFTGAGAIALVTAGDWTWPAFLILALLLIPLAVSGLVGFRAAANRSPWLLTAAAMASLWVFIVAYRILIPTAAVTDGAFGALMLLAGAAPGFAAILLTSGVRWLWYAALATANLAIALLTITSPENFTSIVGTVVIGWLTVALVSAGSIAAVRPALAGIAAIGSATAAGRAASDREARQRHEARLLHDTVLSTLTLLAHSGVGVAKDHMQTQAFTDAQLLRTLRLGDSGGTPSVDWTMPEEATASINLTVSSLQERFAHLGLTVHWHGGTALRLKGIALEAMLLAIGECLENVRRHSGVTEAHVTVAHTDAVQRVTVVDAGTGFDLAAVPEGRLGIAESVRGRLDAVGGTARIFSAPGAGTTISMEVPR